MKRFAFTLKPVLEHRERLEDEKQLFMAARQRELDAAAGELSRLNAQFKQYAVRLREGHKDLNSDELRAHYAHLDYLDRAITMQRGIVAQCRQAVERARLGLLDASKDRKVIEKLKERRLQEYRTLEASAEQKELDDSNNRRFSRGLQP